MPATLFLDPTVSLLPDEKADLVEEARDLLKNADEWLDAPNSQLGGARPWDVIGTAQEPILRDLLRTARYGVAGQ